MKHHRIAAAAGAGVALTASLLAFGTTPALAATTVNVSLSGSDSASCGAVGSECRTITRALANVDAGGTINVGAGTFNERVDITKAVTLVGAGRDATVVGDGTRVTSGPGLLRIAAANGSVTVRNLTVHGASRGTPSSAPLTVYLDSMSTAGTVNTFGNVAITGVGSGGQDYGLYCEDSKADLDVSGSVLTKSDFNPVLLEGCLGTVDLHGNVIEKTAGTAASGAVFAMNNLGAVSVGNQSIRDNVITGAGVSYNVSFQGLNPGSFKGVSITGNQVTGGGVSLNNGATAPNATAAVLQNVVVQGNLLQGTGAGNGVGISGNVTGTHIEGNVISGYATGINQAAAAAGHTPSGTVALANRIVANTKGAATVVPLNAENNWWGCNVVTSCAPVTGAVDQDPSLQLTASASPTSVVVGSSATVTAGLLTNSNGATAPGAFPAGASVAFTTSLGTVTPAAAAMANRVAATSVSSATPGTANVGAQLDGQTVTATVTFTAPPAPPAPTCKLIKLTIAIPLLGIKPIIICI